MRGNRYRPGFLLMAMLLLVSITGCVNETSMGGASPGPSAKLPDAEKTPRPALSADASPQASAPATNTPPMPAKLTEREQGVPVLRVYVKEKQKVERMTVEEYLCGVLAGEMQNTWPMQALEAQAILARTFVLRFASEKESKYDGADISTDIEEAQAYDAASVDANIRKAVQETRGMVLSAQGELPYAWFHAHSGGSTALAKEGLGYEKEEPPYTKVTAGKESDKAPEDAKKWKETFTAAQVLKAASAQGVTGDTLQSMQMGQYGKSGRALTLLINGKSVEAPAFRIALGSTKMRSTLLDEVTLEGGKVTMAGKGYGHGVGMSQWGAYGLADQNESAEDIVKYYFQGVDVVKMY